ncbi:unnamed protein product [Paramecium primaurelia]|uniref:Casein kinase I n=1 Tax=Paramecium primaurelia TaxID=5886 RepID=A0A8S1N3M8_PARPR|nr:unnamed protein product [Paramecium primaurelia]
MYLQAPQYHVLSKIWCGSDHVIYKECAIKIEKSPGIGQIQNEIGMLNKLKGISSIPVLISYGVTPENKSFLIIPLLHVNLGEIAKKKQISLTQILRIRMKITEILEKLHQQNILHLDIKPKNIMISQPLVNDSKIQHPDLIQLIDFRLSQELIRNSKLLKNVFIGSLNFASRQSHKGKQLGYKDDLESLLQVLVYLRNNMYILYPQQHIQIISSQRLIPLFITNLLQWGSSITIISYVTFVGKFYMFYAFIQLFQNNSTLDNQIIMFCYNNYSPQILNI